MIAKREGWKDGEKYILLDIVMSYQVSRTGKYSMCLRLTILTAL